MESFCASGEVFADLRAFAKLKQALCDSEDTSTVKATLFQIRIRIFC